MNLWSSFESSVDHVRMAQNDVHVTLLQWLHIRICMIRCAWNCAEGDFECNSCLTPLIVITIRWNMPWWMHTVHPPPHIIPLLFDFSFPSTAHLLSFPENKRAPISPNVLLEHKHMIRAKIYIWNTTHKI